MAFRHVLLVAGFLGGCSAPEDKPEPQASQGTSPPGAAARMCGGLAGRQCPVGTFCDFGSGTAREASHCGAADQSGTCVSRPEVCMSVYEPVCGCDDKTYSNACMAHVAGVTVLKPGECSAGE
jgi:hypothetical protein